MPGVHKTSHIESGFELRLSVPLLIFLVYRRVQVYEIRRAQVQAAWLVARLSTSPEVAQQLAGAGVVAPLVGMLGAGIQVRLRIQLCKGEGA